MRDETHLWKQLRALRIEARLIASLNFQVQDIYFVFQCLSLYNIQVQDGYYNMEISDCVPKIESKSSWFWALTKNYW